MFIYVYLVFLNWVCWVRGNFFGEPGHIYISCACLSAVWSGGPVQFCLGTLVVWTAGLYGFSFLSGSVVAGTVRLKWWRGGGPCFSLLSSVCCQFSWRLDICGRNFCVIFSVGSFVVVFRGFLFYKVLIVNNLLQVVSQESAPWRGPGASAWAHEARASESWFGD